MGKQGTLRHKYTFVKMGHILEVGHIGAQIYICKKGHIGKVGHIGAYIYISNSGAYWGTNKSVILGVNAVNG